MHCIWLLILRLIIPPSLSVSFTMCKTLIMLNQQNQKRMSALSCGLIARWKSSQLVFYKKQQKHAHLRNQHTQHSFISTLFLSIFSANHCHVIASSHRLFFFQMNFEVTNTYGVQQQLPNAGGTLGSQACNPDVMNKRRHPVSPATESNLSSVMMLERTNQMSQKIMARQILNSPLRDKWLSCHFIPTKQ